MLITVVNLAITALSREGPGVAALQRPSRCSGRRVCGKTSCNACWIRASLWEKVATRKFISFEQKIDFFHNISRLSDKLSFEILDRIPQQFYMYAPNFVVSYLTLFFNASLCHSYVFESLRTSYLYQWWRTNWKTLKKARTIVLLQLHPQHRRLSKKISCCDCVISWDFWASVRL